MAVHRAVEEGVTTMSGASDNSKQARALGAAANRPSTLVGRVPAVQSAGHERPMSGPRGEATDGDPESGIHTDFWETMAYADYLRLDSLLAAQAPRRRRSATATTNSYSSFCTRRPSCGSS